MITPDDLYAIGMESEHACAVMQRLCALLGVAYPPERGDMTEIIGKTALQNQIDDFQIGTPAAC